MKTANIEVKFVMDENGDPEYIESGGMKHYKIEISVTDFPEDVYAVNYQLHSSYVNPFREEVNRDDSFRFTTTAFGDYSIAASLLGKKNNYLASNAISRALKDHYTSTSNPKIEQAVEEIVKH